MTRMWIVVGDITSSGGRVITGSPYTDIDGKPVSRVSDKATCPKHKGVFSIIDGDITMIVDGQPVALHGSSLACGCKVMAAQQSHVFIDVDGGGSSGRRSDAPSVTRAVAAVAPAYVPEKYDEAIRFIDEAGAVLVGVGYTLFLESGRIVSGKTDADGSTERVVTQTPEKIVKAELKFEVAHCCPAHAGGVGHKPKALEISVCGVVTNNVGLGTSIQHVETPKDMARSLTSGEIALAQLIFGDSVKYGIVKIHNGEYLWFGMQSDDTAMTPNGEMYFNAEYFKEDFSTAGISDQMWFIHEMTHIWQYQLGYPVKWRGAVRLGLSYRYKLEKGKNLSDYNMEAQGNILADYYVVRFRGLQRAMFEESHSEDPDALALFESVLANFIREPSARSNLP